jgi:hypothetical protein
VKYEHREYVPVGRRVPVVMPASEVCMHMGLTGKVMHVELVQEGLYVQAQLYMPYGEKHSFPITTGEAGFYHDEIGYYYYLEDSPRSVVLFDDGYMLDENGMIKNPGKFGGMPPYVPYLWNCCEGSPSLSDGYTIYEYELWEEMYTWFPELVVQEINLVHIWEMQDGTMMMDVFDYGEDVESDPYSDLRSHDRQWGLEDLEGYAEYLANNPFHQGDYDAETDVIE